MSAGPPASKWESKLKELETLLHPPAPDPNPLPQGTRPLTPPLVTAGEVFLSPAADPPQPARSDEASEALVGATALSDAAIPSPALDSPQPTRSGETGVGANGLTDEEALSDAGSGSASAPNRPTRSAPRPALAPILAPEVASIILAAGAAPPPQNGMQATLADIEGQRITGAVAQVMANAITRAIAQVDQHKRESEVLRAGSEAQVRLLLRLEAIATGTGGSIDGAASLGAALDAEDLALLKDLKSAWGARLGASASAALTPRNAPAADASASNVSPDGVESVEPSSVGAAAVPVRVPFGPSALELLTSLGCDSPASLSPSAISARYETPHAEVGNSTTSAGPRAVDGLEGEAAVRRLIMSVARAHEGEPDALCGELGVVLAGARRQVREVGLLRTIVTQLRDEATRRLREQAATIETLKAQLLARAEGSSSPPGRRRAGASPPARTRMSPTAAPASSSLARGSSASRGAAAAAAGDPVPAPSKTRQRRAVSAAPDLQSPPQPRQRDSTTAAAASAPRPMRDRLKRAPPTQAAATPAPPPQRGRATLPGVHGDRRRAATAAAAPTESRRALSASVPLRRGQAAAPPAANMAPSGGVQQRQRRPGAGVSASQLSASGALRNGSGAGGAPAPVDATEWGGQPVASSSPPAPHGSLRGRVVSAAITLRGPVAQLQPQQKRAAVRERPGAVVHQRRAGGAPAPEPPPPRPAAGADPVEVARRRLRERRAVAVPADPIARRLMGRLLQARGGGGAPPSPPQRDRETGYAADVPGAAEPPAPAPYATAPLGESGLSLGGPLPPALQRGALGTGADEAVSDDAFHATEAAAAAAATTAPPLQHSATAPALYLGLPPGRSSSHDALTAALSHFDRVLAAAAPRPALTAPQAAPPAAASAASSAAARAAALAPHASGGGGGLLASPSGEGGAPEPGPSPRAGTFEDGPSWGGRQWEAPPRPPAQAAAPPLALQPLSATLLGVAQGPPRLRF